MKVVALSGLSRHAGGVFYAVSSLSKALRRQGVEIAAMGAGNALVEEDRAVWGSVPVMTYNAMGPMQTGIGLRSQLANAEADLVHQHGIWLDDQWASLQWQKKNGKPVVISPHGMLDPWAVRNSAWKKKLVGALFANASLEKATCLHALCKSEADSIRQYGLKTPITIIPNGVELPDATEMDTEFKSAAFEAISGSHKKKLLYLGRIHPKKGLSELVSALAKVSRMNAGWQLLVAGWDDGNHLGPLKTGADALGIKWMDLSAQDPETDIHSSDVEACSLIFLGPVHGRDKAQLMQRVNGFILPSFSEGLPMSVLEAWSYALPVMMTDYCNLPEGFEAGAALRVEPDAESLAKKLDQLASMESSDLVDMGRHGRSLVEQKFTWEKIASDMKAVYEECVSGKRLSV